MNDNRQLEHREQSLNYKIYCVNMLLISSQRKVYLLIYEMILKRMVILLDSITIHLKDLDDASLGRSQSGKGDR